MEEIKYKKRKEIQNWIFLILLALAVFALIYVITTLINNKDFIQQDTLSYGMKQHNFSSCICLDNEEEIWYSNGTGFLTHRYSDFHYSFQETEDYDYTDFFNMVGESVAKINEKNQNGTK